MSPTRPLPLVSDSRLSKRKNYIPSIMSARPKSDSGDTPTSAHTVFTLQPCLHSCSRYFGLHLGIAQPASNISRAELCSSSPEQPHSITNANSLPNMAVQPHQIVNSSAAVFLRSKAVALVLQQLPICLCPHHSARTYTAYNKLHMFWSGSIAGLQ